PPKVPVCQAHKERIKLARERSKSADRRVVPRCSVGSPKVTDLEDAEGQCRRAMEVTKGWIA
ncbi:hypothetical protein MTR67_007362, partial [Solanum verrucosum]